MVNDKVPEDYGAVYPRKFDKCPVCGCPLTFSAEALKEELTPEELKKLSPGLAMMRINYKTRTGVVSLIALVDSCCKCGVIYTIKRDKQKKLNITLPPDAFKIGAF